MDSDKWPTTQVEYEEELLDEFGEWSTGADPTPVLQTMYKQNSKTIRKVYASAVYDNADKKVLEICLAQNLEIHRMLVPEGQVFMDALSIIRSILQEETHASSEQVQSG